MYIKKDEPQSYGSSFFIFFIQSTDLKFEEVALYLLLEHRS